MTRDFYELLGVDEDASKDEIRDAFREMVQEYHPDRNDDPRATAQFTAIKKAYDTLKDSNERQSYDRLGHTDYVAKRLDGIPEPSSWPSGDDGEDDASDPDPSTDQTASGATGRSAGARQRSESTARSSTTGSDTGSSSARSTGTSSTTGASSTAGRSENKGGETSSDSSGSSTTHGNRSSAGSSDRSETATQNSTGNVSAGSAATGTTNAASAGHATASPGGGASASTPGGSTGTTEQHNTGAENDAADKGGWLQQLAATLDSVLNGIWKIRWPAIVLSFLLYITGLAHYGSENADGLQVVVEELQTAGADINELSGLLLSSPPTELTPVYRYVFMTHPVDIGPSIIFALSVVIMPLVFFIVIYWPRHVWRRSRYNYTGRHTSYLFAVAAFLPLVVLAMTSANTYFELGMPVPLLALLLGYGVVPLLAGFVFIGRGLVWKPLRSRLGG